MVVCKCLLCVQWLHFKAEIAGVALEGKVSHTDCEKEWMFMENG